MYELILENISRHVNLRKEDEEYFVSVLQPRKLRKRQYLVQAGDICRFECFVNKGCLRQYYTDDSGLEHILMFGIEDWWISDMYGLITGKPALSNVEALEDSELLLIEREHYDELLEKLPALEKVFRIKLQKAFVAHQRRIIENMSLPAEYRYRSFTEQYPALEQRIPQKYIASYLGITPESLSRIRRQLVDRR
jgi:CRP-like cAMP-binding protein